MRRRPAFSGLNAHTLACRGHDSSNKSGTMTGRLPTSMPLKQKVGAWSLHATTTSILASAHFAPSGPAKPPFLLPPSMPSPTPPSRAAAPAHALAVENLPRAFQEPSEKLPRKKRPTRTRSLELASLNHCTCSCAHGRAAFSACPRLLPPLLRVGGRQCVLHAPSLPSLLPSTTAIALLLSGPRPLTPTKAVAPVACARLLPLRPWQAAMRAPSLPSSLAQTTALALSPTPAQASARAGSGGVSPPPSANSPDLASPSHCVAQAPGLTGPCHPSITPTRVVAPAAYPRLLPPSGWPAAAPAVSRPPRSRRRPYPCPPPPPWAPHSSP